MKPRSSINYSGTLPSRSWRCSPIRVYGVKALSGNQVFESIFQNQRNFTNFNPESTLTLLRAEVEDGLRVCASTKHEERVASRNTLHIRGVPALDLMSTIYAKTPFFQASAKYERNALRVDFSSTLDEYETGYEELIELFGRDMHKTQNPLLGGDVLKIGPPVSKCMLLPRLEATMTVQYSELYGPAERIQKWTNRGTEVSRREFNKIIFSLKHCMSCLRRIAKYPASRNPGQPAFGPTHGCICFQAAANDHDSDSDSNSDSD